MSRKDWRWFDLGMLACGLWGLLLLWVLIQIVEKVAR